MDASDWLIVLGLLVLVVGVFLGWGVGPGLVVAGLVMGLAGVGLEMTGRK